jgi:hypothetical protein
MLICHIDPFRFRIFGLTTTNSATSSSSIRAADAGVVADYDVNAWSEQAAPIKRDDRSSLLVVRSPPLVLDASSTALLKGLSPLSCGLTDPLLVRMAHVSEDGDRSGTATVNAPAYAINPFPQLFWATNQRHADASTTMPGLLPVLFPEVDLQGTRSKQTIGFPNINMGRTLPQCNISLPSTLSSRVPHFFNIVPSDYMHPVTACHDLSQHSFASPAIRVNYRSIERRADPPRDSSAMFPVTHTLSQALSADWAHNEDGPLKQASTNMSGELSVSSNTGEFR